MNMLTYCFIIVFNLTLNVVLILVEIKAIFVNKYMLYNIVNNIAYIIVSANNASNRYKSIKWIIKQEF